VAFIQQYRASINHTIDINNPSVFAYTRTLEGKKLLVLLNFKAKIDTKGLDLSKAKALIGNYATPSVSGQLKPYEAVILEL
jgi:oligo-1,6-glucosidase